MEAREVSGAGRAVGTRRDGIDFWRGFVLCTIFVNHVPGTLFERLTFRNFGFSDSSEAFVLISGLSLALAYGGRVAEGRWRAAVASLARRAVRLYAAHVGLSLAGLALFALGAGLLGRPELMEAHGRGLVSEDPVAALVGLVSLGHQFGYFNILPLYVLLVGVTPVLLLIARFGVAAMLAATFALYLASRLTGLNVPTWPMHGTWFFDPFAWQFLLAVGLAVGLRVRDGGFALPRGLVALAAAVVAGAAFCATDGLGFWPGLHAAVRPFADLDKTTLGLGRIVHALSLACCVQAVRLAEAMRRAPWHRPLCRIGRHGLALFAAASLLSVVGQVLGEALGHSAALDTLVIGSGLVMLCGVARWLDAGDRFRIAWSGRLPAGAVARE